jgi:exopolyphosphatase / guanosine-5'-triphosphate,3'-diphosphate pyrophosphatase
MAIGSGGNINKLFKMTRKKENKPISVNRLKAVCEMVEAYSYEERIKILGMNTDRADVIVPASKILMSILKHSGAEKIIVPQIGLTDGIVHQLYEKHKSRKVWKLEAED